MTQLQLERGAYLALLIDDGGDQVGCSIDRLHRQGERIGFGETGRIGGDNFDIQCACITGARCTGQGAGVGIENQPVGQCNPWQDIDRTQGEGIARIFVREGVDGQGKAKQRTLCHLLVGQWGDQGGGVVESGHRDGKMV